MKIFKIFFCFLLLVEITSCKKEDALGNVDNITGLGGDLWVKGPIDRWIFDSLTVPYNTAVKYKYDQFELKLNSTLVPMKEEFVIPVLSAIKKVWIETYSAETNANFMKKYGNKFFILVGSGNYDLATGAVNLGTTSEDGTKIVMYQLNYFKTRATPGYVPSDSMVAKEVFKTIEHEFAHVLHRNVLYPFTFTQVSSSLYTSDWTNVSFAEAYAEGFVTNYAMSQADDDFAEMVSFMLTQGKTAFDAFVNGINYTGTTANGTTAVVAKQRLRLKESIIVGYFKQSWNIDFYSLQARTRNAMNALLK